MAKQQRFHTARVTSRNTCGEQNQVGSAANSGPQRDVPPLVADGPGKDLARAKKPNISGASNSWSSRDCDIAVIRISPVVTILSRIWTLLVP